MDNTPTSTTLRLLDPPSPVRSLHAVDSTAPACVWVRCVSSALDFYLAVGCSVLHAADGWVKLRAAGTSFVLAQGPDPQGPNGSTVPELPTADLAGVCRRLRALGIEVGDAPGGRITVRDPDRHPVTITQADDLRAKGLPTGDAPSRHRTARR